MSLGITNNNYAGMLAQGISSLILIGSNDSGLFHTKATNGSKVRFSYTSTEVEVQELNGICSFVDAGNRSLDFLNLTLVETGTQQSICKSELYDTDFGIALAGYLAQEVDGVLLNQWVSQTVDGFSTAMQQMRWSGDLGASGATLALMDGIVVQIQAGGAYNASSNPTGYQKIATTAITASNAIEEIKKVIDALPFEVTSNQYFKIVLAPGVASALRNQVMLPSTLNNLPQLTFDPATGLLTSNFFGFKVYLAQGLLVSEFPANNNIIIAGIMADNSEGFIKWGVNKPSDEKNLELKDVQDGDYVRLRLGTGQIVSVIPNLSQVAMNA